MPATAPKGRGVSWRPDGDTTDNLLALPRYRPPFAPPGSDDQGPLDTPDTPTDTTTTWSGATAHHAVASGTDRR